MSRVLIVANWLAGVLNLTFAVILPHPLFNAICAVVSFTVCAWLCYERAIMLYSEGKP